MKSSKMQYAGSTLAAVLMAAWAQTASGGVVYVDGSVGASGDGTSWGQAYKTLNEALLAGAADEIWVKAGTYDPGATLTVTTHTLYGGFAGTETARAQRDWEANETIITGVATRRIFLKTTAGGFTLDGFTLKDGKAVNSTGGALYLSHAGGGLAIRNCLFTNNVATGASAGWGGAVYSLAGAGMENAFSNCLFVANRAEWNSSSAALGAGSLCLSGSAWMRLEDCRFEANMATNGTYSYGGAVMLIGTMGRIDRCTFTGNEATLGGGAILGRNGASVTIADGVFIANRAGGRIAGAVDGGGALFFTGASEMLRLERCRFESNRSDRNVHSLGGAIVMNGGAGQELYAADCVFSNNYAAGSGGAVIAVNVNHATTTALTFSNSVFTANRADAGNQHSTRISGGGALALFANPRLSLYDCRFDSNVANIGIGWNYGGAILATAGTAQKLILNGCDFGGNASVHGGAIFSNVGAATNGLVNCAFVANRTSQGGGALRLWGNNARHEIASSTFFTNSAVGKGGAIYLGNAAGTPQLTLRNSILRANVAATGPEIRSDNGTPALGYASIDTSRISGAYTDDGGLINVNPLFASPTAPYDMHLKSRYGRWDPGQAAWVFDTVNSPCLDAGDPASDFSREPRGNGGRINLGRYGNTPETSKGEDTRGSIMILI